MLVLNKIARYFAPRHGELSFAVIDLARMTASEEFEVMGFNMDAFLYPASIWKVFIAAEILRKIELGILKSEDAVTVLKDEDLTVDIKFFPTGSKADHRPMLQVGESVSIDYLLDLMLTRSDNNASNTLLYLAKRNDINEHIILANGWKGSDVTDEHVASLKSQKDYQYSKVTVSCARHLAELMAKIETGTLVSPWVSEKLKAYMQQWNGKGRTGLAIPEFKKYYRKGGWLEINRYKYGFWNAVRNYFVKNDAVIRWVNDAGVVEGDRSKYAIAILTQTKSRWPWIQFPLKAFSRRIYRYMEQQGGGK